MEADRLTVFRTVAREGGFSKAARKLLRTQPAISQAIRLLEEDLGERLFDRRGRETKLTAAGAVYLEHVDAAFDALERGRARLSARRALLEGELVIGTSDTIACYVLPPVLAAFRAEHPGVEVRISNRPTPVTVDQLRSRDVDVGFVTWPIREKGLRCAPLARREDVAIFAPDHPLADRRRLSLTTLGRHPLLLLDRSSGSRRFIDRCFADAGVTPHITMELASIEVIKQLVRLGFGASIVPAIAVAGEREAGTLRACPVLPRAQQRQVGVALLDGRPVAPAAAGFIDIARSILRRG